MGAVNVVLHVPDIAPNRLVASTACLYLNCAYDSDLATSLIWMRVIVTQMRTCSGYDLLLPPEGDR